MRHVVEISWLLLAVSKPFSHSIDYITLPNKTVSGAVIVSQMIPAYSNCCDKASHLSESDGSSSTLTNIIEARVRNIDLLKSQMPFPIQEWPAIYAAPCPHTKNNPRERGLLYAHYQILFDFVYIDSEVLEKSKQEPNGYFKSKDEFELKSDTYYNFEYRNGKYYRNGNLLSDEDILIVFEDDAYVSKRNITELLYHEFSNMNVDLLKLGWTQSINTPLCTHAYAVTRHGAKQFVRYFDPCGPSADWFMIKLMKHRWITWRVNRFMYNKIPLAEFHIKETDNTTKFAVCKKALFTQILLGSVNNYDEVGAFAKKV